MLIVVSSTLLVFAGCALLYQADDRRSVFSTVRGSQSLRFGMRSAAVFLFAITLIMIATLQGWELGIPVWLGVFSFAFVAGLFLSAQKPDWHPIAGAVSGAAGLLASLGAIIL